MAEPAIDNSRLKAIVFDLDGTLYRQASLRRAMAVRLLRAHLGHPVLGFRTLRAISAYRRAQESLRHAGADVPAVDLEQTQLLLASEQVRADPEFVAACVECWMEREPLSLLSSRIQPDLIAFLRTCQAHGLKLGVLSDYPAQAKLDALGVAPFIDVVVTAQSSDVGAFKPHPRGLLLTLERLHVSRSEALYVGDRPEVDGGAAAAAGVACCILTRGTHGDDQPSWTAIGGFAELQALIFDRRTLHESTASRRALNVG